MSHWINIGTVAIRTHQPMASPTDVITVELVDGTKVVVPDSLELITSYVLQEQGDWFEDEIKFLRQLVQPGDMVVDIGANYGVYALSLARKVGERGQVWAFEPASDTSRLLRESTSANNTPWLQVVQQALSNREGTAWLQMPGQAELNSLAHPTTLETTAQEGSGESVAVSTLDHCLETFGWEGVDLLKIDAEGEEERILQGGKRFFHELSPLVMFEVKAGIELHLNLVARFKELGYRSFRLIPGLNALVPFAEDEKPDGYLLNLFAAKPDRIATLAESSWLVSEDNLNTNNSEANEFIDTWLQALKEKPYAKCISVKWRLDLQQEGLATYISALAAWGLAQNQEQPIASRLSALTISLEQLKHACQAGCNPARWASLARVAHACGERVQAVQALNILVRELQSGKRLDLLEPFLSPDPTFEMVEPNGPIEFWLEAAGLTALEKNGNYSSFYTGANAISRLERVQSLGYTNEEIHRRIELLQQRHGRQTQEADASSAVRPWFDFIGLEEPLRCVDVGALALEGDPAPWESWAQEGCAEVLGFEPLDTECERLNRQAKASGTAIRYWPWALGDGEKHTLHITNQPMTSSLFPPARGTVDLFPGLGEWMQVKEQVRMQTRRLDDIAQARGTDFLKLDVQGAELMILQHAKEVLKSVAIIQCEVEFVELYEGQPLMADIDAFLRGEGFCFMRFAYTMGRPFKPLRKSDSPYKEISQMLWGDAIYVRDFRMLQQWSTRQLQAAAFILHEVYEAIDLTAILLSELDRRELSDLASCYISAVMINRQDLRFSG